MKARVIKMRSLCYTGPNQLELREALKPEPKEGEVLLRVRACGICGSDVHGFLGLTGRAASSHDHGP